MLNMCVCARACRMTANSSQKMGCRGHRSLEGGKGSQASTWRDWGGKAYWELPLMPKTLLKTLLPALSCPRCRAWGSSLSSKDAEIYILLPIGDGEESSDSFVIFLKFFFHHFFLSMVERSLSILYTATPQPTPSTLWRLSVIRGFFEEVLPKASFQTEYSRESESERERKLVGTHSHHQLYMWPLVTYNQIFSINIRLNKFSSATHNAPAHCLYLSTCFHLFLCDAYQSTITLTLPVANKKALSLLSIRPSREESVNLRLNLLYTHLST